MIRGLLQERLKRVCSYIPGLLEECAFNGNLVLVDRAGGNTKSSQATEKDKESTTHFERYTTTLALRTVYG